MGYNKSQIFLEKLKCVINKNGLKDSIYSCACFSFLNFLIEISTSNDYEILKITKLTIIFEAFYRFINIECLLKTELTIIRFERWGNHYGVPTVTFLLTYQVVIEKIFLSFADNNFLLQPISFWDAIQFNKLRVDNKNFVLIDPQSFNDVTMPLNDEKPGHFLKTHNSEGGFTTAPSDPVSKKFIDYAAHVSTETKILLEIGAAFGAASLQLVMKNVNLFCNDIDFRNLAVIKNKYEKKSNNFVEDDCKKLVFVPGSCPDELEMLPKNYFDAVLISRVLHFFPGIKIEKSLRLFFECLKPKGKLFVICETPFLKNWQNFLPIYEKRVVSDVKWPGEITNPAEYESSGRSASLPKFVHWLTKEILNSALIEAKFEIEYLSYIDRKGQFPDDLLLDGRESIGAIAIKPNCI